MRISVVLSELARAAGSRDEEVDRENEPAKRSVRQTAI